MFNSLHRTAAHRFRAVVIWAMIPLALWSTRPSAGCICADGHFELICKSALCASKPGSTCEAAAPRCSCCHTSVAKHSEGQSKGCCSDKAGASSTCAASASDGGCCSPVVQPELLLVSVTQLDQQYEPIVLCFADLNEYRPSGANLGRFALVDSEHMPCGDIVITFRRLLI